MIITSLLTLHYTLPVGHGIRIPNNYVFSTVNIKEKGFNEHVLLRPWSLYLAVFALADI